MGKVDLGEKLPCSSCGARYYDLNKMPALCPKCGAENERPKKFTAKKTATAAPKPALKSAAPEAKKDGGSDEAEDIDDIEAGGDDENDDLLGNDDDDVGGVIGSIDSPKNTPV